MIYLPPPPGDAQLADWLRQLLQEVDRLEERVHELEEGMMNNE